MTPYPVKGTPREHQLRALIEAAEKPGHCYFLDPGGGKTFVCIAEASKLWVDGKIDGVLIFAPNRPHRQWVEEQFPLWCGISWHGNHNQEPPGRMRKWLEAGERTKKTSMGVLAVNYEAARTPKVKELIEKFRAIYPRIYLIVDESQKVKTPRAKRTLAIMAQALKSDYRRILSGTPLLKGLEDLWSQYEIAQPGLGWPAEPIALSPRGKINDFGYNGYKAHYCVEQQLAANPRAKFIVGYRNQDHLRERVAPHVTRVLSEEFSPQEKPDIIPVPITMSAEQTRRYNSMRDDLVAQIDDELITADNALVQMGKLLQIANGFLYREDRNEGWEQFSTTKVDDALERIEMLRERVIVWSPFIAQQQIFLIHANDLNELKKWEPRGIYTKNTLEQWKEDPTGVLVGNQGSGLGVGLNLQMCAANIYMANTFAAEQRWQSIARTDRMGQTRQVRVWDQISDDTLEVKVLAKLAQRAQLSRENIDALRTDGDPIATTLQEMRGLLT